MGEKNKSGKEDWSVLDVLRILAEVILVIVFFIHVVLPNFRAVRAVELGNYFEPPVFSSQLLTADMYSDLTAFCDSMYAGWESSLGPAENRPAGFQQYELLVSAQKEDTALLITDVLCHLRYDCGCQAIKNQFRLVVIRINPMTFKAAQISDTILSWDSYAKTLYRQRGGGIKKF